MLYPESRDVSNCHPYQFLEICIPLCNDPIGLIQKGHLKYFHVLIMLTADRVLHFPLQFQRPIFYGHTRGQTTTHLIIVMMIWVYYLYGNSEFLKGFKAGLIIRWALYPQLPVQSLSNIVYLGIFLLLLFFPLEEGLRSRSPCRTTGSECNWL